MFISMFRMNSAMYARMRGTIAPLLLLVACVPVEGALGAETAKKAPSGPAMKFGLAISGGVSLGSYEAGLNWAFIKHLKTMRNHAAGEGPAGDGEQRLPPDIVAITGASAGSINTLLTALTWCMNDYLLDDAGLGIANSLTSNIFQRTWLTPDINQLLPEDADRELHYNADDLLFSRKAFDPAIRKIAALLEAPIYDACSVPFAFTLTRIRSERLSTAGITVDNSRFVIPMKLVSDGERPGKIKIIAYSDASHNPQWGNVIYLPGVESGGVFVMSTDDVIRAMLASSSFPIAFGSKKLDYCLRTDATSTDRGGAAPDAACPATYKREQDYFIDGGVFDNVPLGTTKELAEPRRYGGEDEQKRINYAYLDPGNRRGPYRNSGSEAPRKSSAKGGHDDDLKLLTQVKFLSGAIKTGLDYELYNVLRSGEWNHRLAFSVKRTIQALGIPDDDPKKPYCTRPDVAARSCDGPAPNLAPDRGNRDDVIACLCRKSRVLEESGTLKKRAAGFADARKDLAGLLLDTANRLGNQELHYQIKTALADTGGERAILLSSRYFPITGDFLNHFGAFLEESFRYFDYYTGIYDAVHDIAKFRCEGAMNGSACLADETRTIYHRLGIEADDAGRRVFLSLAAHEHPAYSDPTMPWYWVAEGLHAPIDESDKVQNVLHVMNTLRSLYDADPENTIEFSDFIPALAVSGYRNAGPVLQEIFDKRDRDQIVWYYALTSRASERLKHIIDKESALVKKPILSAAGSATMLAVNTIIDDERFFEWSRSTVSPSASWYWHIVPYEISADVRNGGWTFSWEPRMNFSQHMSLNFKLTPWIEDRYGDTVRRLSQADLYLSYKNKGGFISSVGVGPSAYAMRRDYQQPHEKSSYVGASGYLGFIGDKLRLTIGFRSVNRNYYPAEGDNLYIMLGLTDLPGLAYWFMH